MKVGKKLLAERRPTDDPTNAILEVDFHHFPRMLSILQYRERCWPNL